VLKHNDYTLDVSEKKWQKNYTMMSAKKGESLSSERSRGRRHHLSDGFSHSEYLYKTFFFPPSRFLQI
jgi:hypothetical protein